MRIYANNNDIIANIRLSDILEAKRNYVFHMWSEANSNVKWSEAKRIFIRENDSSEANAKEDAGTFGIYKLFWNYLNSCEFDDLPLFLVSEEGVSKRLHEN